MADTTTAPAPRASTPERAFNWAIIISGIRCLVFYIAVPFFAPLIGLSPRVGPVLGIAISVVAIAANVVSMRRFIRSRHRWWKPVVAIHAGVIVLILVLVAIDISRLVG